MHTTTSIVSGITMKLAGGSAVIAGALFKVILGLARIGSLAMVRRLRRTRPAADQCVGLAIAGWLTLDVTQIAAEPAQRRRSDRAETTIGRAAGAARENGC